MPDGPPLLFTRLLFGVDLAHQGWILDQVADLVEAGRLHRGVINSGQNRLSWPPKGKLQAAKAAQITSNVGHQRDIRSEKVELIFFAGFSANSQRTAVARAGRPSTGAVSASWRGARP